MGNWPRPHRFSMAVAKHHAVYQALIQRLQGAAAKSMLPTVNNRQ